MTQATEIIDAPRASHGRVVGAVSAAHFVSHYFMLVLAPLIPFVREEYGVSYTEIGFAFAAFNVVSAVLQTPTGFLVDRLGARKLLIAGLLIGGGAFVAAGAIHSFWVMVVMFAIAGLGNTVYHPADYALLSQHVPSRSMGHAFSMHGFAGMLGSAVAPATVLMMQSVWGWRGAFIAAGLLGFAAAALMLSFRDSDNAAAHGAPRETTPDGGSWRLLMSPPILLNLVFFMLLAIMAGGITNYSVVALAALYDTPLVTANGALTGHLLLTAIGVLAGGIIATRTNRHGTVTALGLAAFALSTAVVTGVDFAAVALIGVFSLGGLCIGLTMPSRDMIVRAATPPGSFGKVFGFVTTGFNLGGIVAPLIFGPLLDHGAPRLVFAAVAVFAIAAIATVVTLPRATIVRP